MQYNKIYEHYWEKGWVIVNNVFSSEVVDEFAKCATDFAKEINDSSDIQLTDKTRDGSYSLPRKIGLLFGKNEQFTNFIKNKKLFEILQILLNKKPLLYAEQLFFKPPKIGTAKQYHQDNFYFKMSPADSVITAWIALDDVDEENACMRYIDGSHKNKILPHTKVLGSEHNETPPTELIDISKESLAEVKKGAVIFHHSMSLHCSHDNLSERWRRAYATHWITEDVVKNTKLESGHFNSKIYKNILYEMLA